MRLKDLQVRDRPRERLLEKGASALSDAELLAIILRTGSRNEHVVAQASRILAQYGLLGLSRAPVTELLTTTGLGVAKASQIVAAFELGRRTHIEEQPSIITCRKDAINYCQPLIGHLEQENFLVVWLGVKKQVIGHDIITKGLVDSSLVHAREVFRGALKANASSIIIAHNHPSGDLSPSDEDVDVTSRLTKAGELLGVTVIDHIIVGKQ